MASPPPPHHKPSSQNPKILTPPPGPNSPRPPQAPHSAPKSPRPPRRHLGPRPPQDLPPHGRHRRHGLPQHQARQTSDQILVLCLAHRQDLVHRLLQKEAQPPPQQDPRRVARLARRRARLHHGGPRGVGQRADGPRAGGAGAGAAPQPQVAAGGAEAKGEGGARRDGAVWAEFGEYERRRRGGGKASYGAAGWPTWRGGNGDRGAAAAAAASGAGGESVGGVKGADFKDDGAEPGVFEQDLRGWTCVPRNGYICPRAIIQLLPWRFQAS